MYFDKAYDRKLFEETEREAFMFRDPKAVNLILKTGFKGKLPPKLAWVFPLPSKPLSYKEVEPALFDELRDYFSQAMQLGGGTDSMTNAVPARAMLKGIAVHEKVIVGGYEIIPIEIVKESGAGEELNQWLRNQNFIELPARIQKPYLKKGAYFLAIRMNPRGAEMSVKPLWIRYASDHMSFPLRFTHDERTFDFTLYFLGPDAVVAGASGNQVKTACVYLERLKGEDLPGFLTRTREITHGAVSPAALYRIELKGINKVIMTSRMAQDPELVEKSASHFCG
jgi:hypothetical protein